MSRKIFGNYQNMVSEIAQLERDENPRREDRVTVSDFFHGQPPYSDDEAAQLGITVNVNNLFGYEQMDAAKDQLLALYTTPPRLWEVQLDRAPSWCKEAWEQKATMHWNRIMKDSGRLKHHYEFAAGDATMHGEGFLCFTNMTDWCPRHVSLARRLVPTLATLDVNELSHFAIGTDLPFGDVVRFQKSYAKGWNKGNLNLLLDRVFKSETKSPDMSSDIRNAIESQNVELLANYRQANAGVDRMWKYSVPVTYFFQRNYDNPLQAFDCTLFSRDTLTGFDPNKDGDAGEAVLFEREGHFPTASQCIFPMHMNCVIGGEPLWNRLKGQGHLNYSLSWHLEALFSRAIQAAHEQGTTFFQAADSASREAMEQILLKHNGIIPEGITMVPNRVGGDFQGLLSLVQVLRQQGAANSNTIAPNNGAEGTNALQVQAIFQQNMVGAKASNRVTHWFEYMNRVGREIWRRFVNPLIQPFDAGYSEIMAFQAAMIREGIPLHYLQPENVRITTARVVGDGVRQKAEAAVQALVPNIGMFQDEGQEMIKRMLVAVTTDDYALAEKMVPYGNKPASDQVRDANEENNTFLLQQIPQDIHADDHAQVHLKIHMDFMANLVLKGAKEQQMHFTADQMKAFTVCGGHCFKHVREQVAPVNKAAGKKYEEELAKLAAMGQKLANNLAQAQEAQQQQQPEVDPVKKAELLLKQQALAQGEKKIELSAKKHEDSQALREQQLALREHEAANRHHLALTKDIRDDHSTRQEMAIRDAEAAAGIGAPETP